MKTSLQRILVIVANTTLFALSAYCVWGWITISDIRVKCEKKGYDFDEVMASLITTAGDVLLVGNALTGSTNIHQVTDKFPGMGRFALSFISVSSERKTVQSKDGKLMNVEFTGPSGFSGGLIEPFAFLSDNFVNFIFCLGVGYLMSSTLLLLKFLKDEPVSLRYTLIRPVAGSLVAGCFFIIVLSGGALFWGQTSQISGLSIGILSAFGSVYCERFERILKKSLAAGEKTSS